MTDVEQLLLQANEAINQQFPKDAPIGYQMEVAITSLYVAKVLYMGDNPDTGKAMLKVTIGFAKKETVH